MGEIVGEGSGGEWGRVVGEDNGGGQWGRKLFVYIIITRCKQRTGLIRC